MKIRRIGKSNGNKTKFGIKIPRYVKEALLFDRESKNTKWADAICEEILKLIDLNVFKFHSPNTAFKKIDEWQYAPMHMVFTIKQEDLRHKAKLVINGNVVDASNVNKYSPTVKITSVRLVFLMAVYKKLSIMTSGIMNAFPTAPCREKIWSEQVQN